MVIAILSSFILLYAFALLYFATIWKSLPELQQSGELKSVTILIPFRNETKNLHKLLESISNLDYPVDLLTVILVNDHSTDDYEKVIRQSESAFPFKLLFLNLPYQSEGKKSAIKFGVEHSDSEIILTSDADCQFSKDWVQKMQAPFEWDHIELVSGNVVFTSTSFLSKIFQMEFAPLIGVGAVSIELGSPNMANGANLAFRRSTFVELKPFADNLNIPSGDDIFLLQKIKGNYPAGVFFQKDAVVFTTAPQGFNSFCKQRKRWAAKWKASSSLVDSVPAFLVWIFHLVYITTIFYGILSQQFFILIPVLTFKILAEANFIYRVLASQKQYFNAAVFIILQLFYSFYLLIFGLLANFGSYTWKERRYNSNERSGN